MIKKFFKRGLGVMLPSLLVVVIFYWVYNSIEQGVRSLLPYGLLYEWWHSIVFAVGVFVLILILGAIFTYLAPVRWIKEKIERYLVKRVPGIKQVYEFGQEITDSFLSDIKNDGEVKIVEIVYAGRLTLGLMTDKDKNIVFVPTAPNPINGFVFRLTEKELSELRYIDMTITEFLKILTSLGKIGGEYWK